MVVPPIVAAVSGRRLTRPRAAVVLWCLVLLLSNVVSFTLGSRGVNNLWVGYVALPLTTMVLLWALSRWQISPSASLALTAAIPLILVASVGLTLAIEDRRTFSLVVAPFHSIVALLAAMWTFVSLSMKADSRITREDWFWIIGGIMLYAATTTAMQPLAWYLIRERVDLLHAAFNVRAAVMLLSFAAITWGMLPRGTRRYSGGSSSPPSSPSSSSSAA